MSRWDYLGVNVSSSFKAYLWLDQLARTQESGSDYPEDLLPRAILCDRYLTDGDAFGLFRQLRLHPTLRDVPFVVIADPEHCEAEDQLHALQAGIHDFYFWPIVPEHIKQRIAFFRKYPMPTGDRSQADTHEVFRIPWWKRLFDLTLGSLLLLLTSPLFLLIAMLIKLESPGPVFYLSRRAGTGYRVFTFYKFRSMRQGAEEELDRYLHLNQYRAKAPILGSQERCIDCIVKGKACDQLIQVFGRDICQREWERIRHQDSQSGKSSFVKLDNDPRVTRVGKLLRTSSLDELPQLINVLRGDMSIVGNRPLPLYEAEQLTTDLWAKRFLAPAGITGLWQVSRRNQTDLSEAERKALDVAYADRASFWHDLKIVIRTIPALFQHRDD